MAEINFFYRLFHLAKRVTIVGLTLGLVMWPEAPLSVRGQWFLMWQSKTWKE